MILYLIFFKNACSCNCVVYISDMTLQYNVHLTHFPLDKTAAISQTIFSDAFFLSKFRPILFLRVQLTALVQVMDWRRIGDKPLSEPMLARFTDAYTGGDELKQTNLFYIQYHMIDFYRSRVLDESIHYM